MHHIEELAGAPYHMQPEPARARILTANGEIVRHLFLHRYGPERRFSVLEPAYLERGIQRTGQIGNAVMRLVRARPMVELTLQALRANINILIRP
jgi:aminoglycoside N3'-acetyltransferase